MYFERGKSLASPDGLTGGKPRRWGQQTYVKERDFSIPAKKRKKENITHSLKIIFLYFSIPMKCIYLQMQPLITNVQNIVLFYQNTNWGFLARL